jgi:DNA polymerase-1
VVFLCLEVVVRFVAWDVETWKIEPGLLAPPLVCVSWAERVNDQMVTGLLDRAAGLDFMQKRLEDPDVTVIAHNECFDGAVICSERPDLIPLVFKALREGRMRCTQVRQTLREIAQGRKQVNGKLLVFRGDQWAPCDYRLMTLSKVYLGKDRSLSKSDPNAWRLHYARLADVPVEKWPKDARDYAIEDAEDALEIFERQTSELGAVLPTEIEQTCAAFALHLMSCWGMRTDPTRVAELEKTITEAQRRNQKVLTKVKFLKPVRMSPGDVTNGDVPDWYEEVEKGRNLTKREAAEVVLAEGERLDTSGDKPRLVRTVRVPYRWGKDTKAIKAYVERVYGRKGKPVPRTETDEVATDKDAMYESGSRILKLVADGGGVDKIADTYLPVLKRGTSVPINCRYNVLVNSGRTSCSEPNIQNLPSGKRVGGVRECFIPRGSTDA